MVEACASLRVAGGVLDRLTGSLPPLAALQDTPLGPYRLRLTDVTSRGYVEQVNFALHLCDSEGAKATPPVFSGTYSGGRPSGKVKGWIDGVYGSPVCLTDGRQVHLAEEGLDRPLFARLGALIPRGGRLMLAYEAFHLDSPLLRQTAQGLCRGVPPLATPVGQLLFYADCWLGVRDWYIPEGGREGPRKLQGNKALDEAHRRQRAEEAVEQLLSFLDRTGSEDDPLIQDARRRGATTVRMLLEQFVSVFA